MARASQQHAAAHSSARRARPALAPLLPLIARPHPSAPSSPFPFQLRATTARDHRRGRRDPYTLLQAEILGFAPLNHPLRARFPILAPTAATAPQLPLHHSSAGAEPRAAVSSPLRRTTAFLESRRRSAEPPRSLPSRTCPNSARVAPVSRPEGRRRWRSCPPDLPAGFTTRSHDDPRDQGDRSCMPATAPRTPFLDADGPRRRPCSAAAPARFEPWVSAPSPP